MLGACWVVREAAAAHHGGRVGQGKGFGVKARVLSGGKCAWARALRICPSPRSAPCSRACATLTHTNTHAYINKQARVPRQGP